MCPVKEGAVQGGIQHISSREWNEGLVNIVHNIQILWSVSRGEKEESKKSWNLLREIYARHWCHPQVVIKMCKGLLILFNCWTQFNALLEAFSSISKFTVCEQCFPFSIVRKGLLKTLLVCQFAHFYYTSQWNAMVDWWLVSAGNEFRRLYSRIELGSVEGLFAVLIFK